MLKLSDLRKRRREEEDLWPISLADMMTMLLCFFLLLVAVSQVDISRYERVADSMQKALAADKPAPPKREEPDPPSVPRRPQPPKPEQQGVRVKVDRTLLASEPLPPAEGETPQSDAAARPAETSPAKTEAEHAERTGPTKKSLDDIRKELVGKLGSKKGEVELVPRDVGVELNLRGAAFFDLASAEIKPGGLTLMREIASTLAGTPYKVTVEGHTDNLPIESWLYPSNWELSSARASRVARYLIDHGVPRDRMRVEGLADTQPVVPNAGPDGRAIPENQAQNRRVVILVSP